MTTVRIRDHAYLRAAERFGWKGMDATTRITRLYEESRYFGRGQGNTTVLQHQSTNVKMLVEYREGVGGYVSIITLLLPEHSASMQSFSPDPHVEPNDKAIWDEWVERNGGKPR